MKSILLDINYLLDTILIFDLDYASNDDFLNWLTRSMLFFLVDVWFSLPSGKKKKTILCKDRQYLKSEKQPS